MSLRPSDRLFTIVASIESASTDVRYTLTILSDADIAIDPVSSRGFHSKPVIIIPFMTISLRAHLFYLQISGNLSTRTSGGNHTYPTFMLNPQYKLTIRPSTSTQGNELVNLRAPLIVSAKGPKDLPLNVKVVWTADGRVTEWV
jgi:calpain-7